MAASADGRRLLIELDGNGLSRSHLDAAVDLMERVFATRVDTSTLEADVAADPVFATAAQRFRGLRPVLIADPFETLVWAILGQQINVSFAAKLKRALVERFGERVHGFDRDFLLFPEPQALTGLDHERDLRPLQFSRQKSDYVIGAAHEIAAGRLDFDNLRALEPEDAIARLVSLKGIGRWTAEYMLMRGLGFPDVLPAGDGGLRRVIGREYGLGHLASEAEVRAIAAHWSPWRGYAAFYWWLTLQLEARARG
ncbi:MAG: DNA-3-methyladenine glycosylase 2 family protein [Chloroflexi bacterium]|nr:DNA-3-methyladenine glycosylase 2 family protein [Chloroflexota bacterium]